MNPDNGLSVDEVQTVNNAIVILEAHGYTTAAEALKDVCVNEFQLIAEEVRNGCDGET